MNPIARPLALLALALTIAAGCPAGDPLDTPEDAPPAGARAVFADPSGLFALDPATGARTPLAPHAVHWCLTDPRSRALWYTTAAADLEGSDEPWRYLLWVLDLSQPGAAPVHVATLPVPDVALNWADEEVGVPPGHRFAVKAVLRLSAAPTLEPRLGCEGDQAPYCYGDEDHEGRPLLSDELVALRRTIAETRLDHADLLAALAARGATGRHTLAAPSSPAAPARVAAPETAGQAAPEDCGTSVPVPGTDLLAVVVANSRGDFHHEARALYDPASERFLDNLRTTLATSAPPVGLDPMPPLRILPGGRFWLTPTALVDRAHGVAVQAEHACGWTTPAYELQTLP